MRQCISLNTDWVFSKTADGVPAAMPEDWERVNLPHTWNAADGVGKYYRGRCFYAKNIDRRELPPAERYYLEIRGANASADVYMNGRHLAHHDGGYSTFRVDVTEHLGDAALLTVAVDNGENDAVYPQMADFTFYGGLYRDVNLLCVSRAHFDLDYYGGPGVKVTPTVAGRDALVEVRSFPVNAAGLEVRYTVRAADGAVIDTATVTADSPDAVFTIENARLWDGRRDPYLYTLEASLLRGGEAVDGVSVRFGVRTFDIDPERGFLLNGRPYPLRGVSRHQDRQGFGNALLPEHHREDMDLICELGANAVRLAHYQHDQVFYDLCDERGLVVWAEIPYISRHMPAGRENTLSQLRELIVQNYNHPSIAVWALSNEITIQGGGEDLLENHRLLNDLAHRLDPTRKTVVAAVSMCDVHEPYLRIPDAAAYNHYFGWYGGEANQYGPWFDSFHREFPQIPIAVSEFGCEALNWHSSEPMQGDYTEEYQAHYHEEVIKQLYTRPYLWGSFVWNMFDFGAAGRNEGGEAGQNHKGLVTFDRKYKKDAFYAYKAWLSDEPFVHICGKRYVDRAEDVTRVTVYSNQPEAELFANGGSLGKQAAPDHFFYFDVPNAGETRLKAVAGACVDESVIRKAEKFNEDYRLKDKNAVLNWFDVKEREGFLSLNSKMSEVLAAPEGAALTRELLAQAAGGKAGAFDLRDFMDLAGGFSVLRLTSLAAGSLDMAFTKEQLLDLNEKLNAIPKAEKK